MDQVENMMKYKTFKEIDKLKQQLFMLQNVGKYN